MNPSDFDLRITLITSGGRGLDDPNTCTTTWSISMDDCTVHAWMQVFEQVLRAKGFSDRVIMNGACQLAFNERRSDADMKAVADEYGLTLQELALEP
jgi:hypothetical protein